MTTAEARAIAESIEARDRARLNLINTVRQPIHQANPEYPRHQERIAQAGDAYVIAQRQAEQLLVGHAGQVPADVALEQPQTGQVAPLPQQPLNAGVEP